MNKDQQLLQDAVREIKILRQANESMNLRLQMFDNCMTLLTARIHEHGMGMSEDLCWKIEKHIESENNSLPREGKARVAYPIPESNEV